MNDGIIHVLMDVDGVIVPDNGHLFQIDCQKSTVLPNR
jgi:hypothetical protein